MSEYLVKTGCDVNARNNDGQTAGHKAALAGYRQVLQALMTRGADFNVQVIVVVLMLQTSCKDYSILTFNTMYLVFGSLRNDVM